MLYMRFGSERLTRTTIVRLQNGERVPRIFYPQWMQPYMSALISYFYHLTVKMIPFFRSPHNLRFINLSPFCPWDVLYLWVSYCNLFWFKYLLKYRIVVYTHMQFSYNEIQQAYSIPVHKSTCTYILKTFENTYMQIYLKHKHISREKKHEMTLKKLFEHNNFKHFF